jgi:hypothetical protein
MRQPPPRKAPGRGRTALLAGGLLLVVAGVAVLAWALAAAAVLRSLELEEDPAGGRRARLALAEALLEAPPLRLRGIAAERILEGLVARHLV